MDEIDERDWVPVLPLGAGVFLGYSAEGFLTGDHIGPKRIVDLNFPIGLLPLLERPYSQLLTDLDGREQELGLPSGFLRPIARVETIGRVVFASQIDYWVQKLLSWLEEMPVSELDDVVLRELNAAAWTSQRARHRSRALLRRLADQTARQ